MPTVITRDQYLEVNSVPLATPAWRILDLSKLYGLDVRGSDRLLPGADGLRATRRRIDQRVIGLPFIVIGAADHEGTTNADPYEGLDDNIDYLMTNVVAPTTTTRTAVWHRANGNVSAAVFVEGLTPDTWGNGWVRFVLELSIPAGRFT